MKKPAVWITLILAAVLAGVLLHSTMGARRYRVEVCMSFGGRQICRTAAAATSEQALRAATDNACALLASGMAASIACGNTPPAKVTWLEER